jgi:hypothetical protein
MKKLILLLASALTLVSASAAPAAATKAVEEVFLRYWDAYSKKDFGKAAAEVLPSDLEATKAEVLPVFLAGQSAKNREAQEVLGSFFAKTVGSARAAISATEVFAGLNRVVAAANPEMFEAFKSSTVAVIFVRTVDADTAEVHFQVTVRGASETDAETFVKKNGRWWLKVKDDPKEAAASFKALFARPA